MYEAKAQRSRRALIGAGVGALAAGLAASLGRPQRVKAANGDPVELGSADNTADDTTKITNAVDGDTVFWGRSTGSGIGIRGSSQSGSGILGSSASSTGIQGESSSGIAVIAQSTSGQGVFGSSTQNIGVYADSNAPGSPASLGYNRANGTGVLGYSSLGFTGQPATQPKTGVYGEATHDAGSRGVSGKSAAGQAVRGEATSGVGLFGTATTGFALQTTGRVKLSTSGVATIAANTKAKSIAVGVDVTADTFVLLTPGVDIGARRLWYTKDLAANTITIRLSSSRSSATRVSWLLLG